jgi:hydrogen peroxide-dependent heme synthase
MHSNPRIEEINQTIRYTNWTALRRIDSESKGYQQTLEEFADWIDNSEIELRGAYDLTGFRGGADLLLWLHAPKAEQVQSALTKFENTDVGSRYRRTWSAMGLHRPAEFNKSHVPGFMLGKEAKAWLCMYPFVRSYNWYLLPEAERREMLIEHGVAGHKFPGILSSTVASFGLGDYEWLLALESDDLYEIVDMMRDLRYTKARLHVREELPFFTGKRISLAEIGANL